MTANAVFVSLTNASEESVHDKNVTDVLRALELHANDLDPNRFVPAMAAARIRPQLFLARRPGGATCVRWLSKSNGATKSALQVLACGLLLRAHDADPMWPVEFIQCYLEDSFASRVWCDDPSPAVRLFVANLLTFFDASTAPGIVNRYPDASNRTPIVQYVIDQARFVLEHDPTMLPATIKTLTPLVCVPLVRDLVALHLRAWLRDATFAPLAKPLAIALLHHAAADDGTAADQKLSLSSPLAVVFQVLDLLLGEPSLDVALRRAVGASRNAALLALDAAFAGSATILDVNSSARLLLLRATDALLVRSRRDNVAATDSIEAVLARQLSKMALTLYDANDDDSRAPSDEALLRLTRGRRQLYALLVVLVTEMPALDTVELCYALLDDGAVSVAREMPSLRARTNFADTLARCATWAVLLRSHTLQQQSPQQQQQQQQFKQSVAQFQSHAVAWCHKSASALVAGPLSNERDGVLASLLRRLLFVLPDGGAAAYFPDSSLGAAAQVAALSLATEAVPLLEATLVHLIVMRLSRMPLSADDVVGAVESLVARAAATAAVAPLASYEQLVDGLINVCRVARPASLSNDAPASVVPCHSALLWRVIVALALLGALHGATIGNYLWRAVPTVGGVMRALLTQRWRASGNGDNERHESLLRQCAAAQLRDEGVVVERDDAPALLERVAQWRAAGLVAFERDSTLLVPSEALRRHVQHIDATLRVSERLARSRAPDFVLDAASADEAAAPGSAAPWLARLLRANEALIESVPPMCRCAVLVYLVDDAELRRSVAASLRALLQLRDNVANDSPLPTVDVLSFFLGRLSAPLASMRDVACECLNELLTTSSESSTAFLEQITRLPWYDAEPVRRVVCDSLASALAIETSLERFAAYCTTLSRSVGDEHRVALAVAVAKTLLSRPLLRAAITSTHSDAVWSVLVYGLQGGSVVDQREASAMLTPPTGTARRVPLVVLDSAVLLASASDTAHNLIVDGSKLASVSDGRTVLIASQYWREVRHGKQAVLRQYAKEQVAKDSTNTTGQLLEQWLSNDSKQSKPTATQRNGSILIEL